MDTFEQAKRDLMKLQAEIDMLQQSIEGMSPEKAKTIENKKKRNAYLLKYCDARLGIVSREYKMMDIAGQI